MSIRQPHECRPSSRGCGRTDVDIQYSTHPPPKEESALDDSVVDVRRNSSWMTMTVLRKFQTLPQYSIRSQLLLFLLSLKHRHRYQPVPIIHPAVSSDLFHFTHGISQIESPSVKKRETVYEKRVSHKLLAFAYPCLFLFLNNTMILTITIRCMGRKEAIWQTQLFSVISHSGNWIGINWILYIQKKHRSLLLHFLFEERTAAFAIAAVAGRPVTQLPFFAAAMAAVSGSNSSSNSSPVHLPQLHWWRRYRVLLLQYYMQQHTIGSSTPKHMYCYYHYHYNRCYCWSSSSSSRSWIIG